jgi:hypothetical protein
VKEIKEKKVSRDQVYSALLSFGVLMVSFTLVLGHRRQFQIFIFSSNPEKF